MRRMGLVQCGLAPLEPGIWPSWNSDPAEQLTRFGPGEVHQAVPWTSLNREQQDFQRTKMAIHAAMITRMDREIGRVLDQLKRMGQYDDTLIFFLSDNGASAEIMIRADGHDRSALPGSARTHLCLGPGWSSAANSPFRLHKSWVHEGGIASPWIAHWRNGIADRGRLRHNPCHFIDVVPTLVDLAGGDPTTVMPPGAPPLTGKSLAGAFRRDQTVPHDFLYFHHNGNRALRKDDWKLVSRGTDGPWELYHLDADRCEQRNLAATEPARVSDMVALWRQVDGEYARTREEAPPLKGIPV
jgi:arylsulfatase